MSPSQRIRPDPVGRARRLGPRVQLPIAALLLLLGFAAVVQVRSVQQEGPLASARQGDLVQILDDLDNRNDRLRAELAQLERAQRDLTTGTDRAAAALAQTRRRAAALGVLAGTVPAVGPGVVVTMSDPQRRIGAAVLLDALQELRAAGAEAVQIAGPAGSRTAVRVVASTAFVDVGGGVEVGGTLLRAPFRFTVVGDPATLAQALAIPGGVLDTVQARGGRATIQRTSAAQVTALSSLRAPRYARPS